MSGQDKPTGVALPLAALDRLMPMHALVSLTGHILHAGPTLEKLRPGTGFMGTRFLEAFELRRPRGIDRINQLAVPGGTQVNLRLRERLDVPLKGVAIALPKEAGLLVNLSFGIAAVEAVGIFDLSAGDFPPTDLTVEMLYLVEAKEAVMEESRNLNLRLQGARVAAEKQAYTDTLTGLRNRRGLDMILDRYAKCGEKFSLMHLDLDFFKAVNDTLGHAAGDYVLQEVAHILMDVTRDEDTVIRVGGDEFVLVFHRLTNADTLGAVAKRILARLEEPIIYQDGPCKISGSIGITVSDDYPEPAPEQMLLDADMALYASKNAGRAQFTFVRTAGGAAASAASAGAVPSTRRQA